MKTPKAQARSITPILKRADFLRLQQSGRKWVTPHFVIQVAPFCGDCSALRATASATSPTCRLGLTITKKVFPRAVDRNRVRRRLRALVLDVLSAQPPKLDIVVIARVTALKIDRAALEKDLKWALKRLLAPEKPVAAGEK